MGKQFDTSSLSSVTGRQWAEGIASVCNGFDWKVVRMGHDRDYSYMEIQTLFDELLTEEKLAILQHFNDGLRLLLAELEEEPGFEVSSLSSDVIEGVVIIASSVVSSYQEAQLFMDVIKDFTAVLRKVYQYNLSPTIGLDRFTSTRRTLLTRMIRSKYVTLEEALPFLENKSLNVATWEALYKTYGVQIVPNNFRVFLRFSDKTVFAYLAVKRMIESGTTNENEALILAIKEELEAIKTIPQLSKTYQNCSELVNEGF